MYLLFGSNAAGPASSGSGIRNGAPGSNGTCAACHGGGTGTTTASISLKVKASGAAVTGSYTPGTVYTVSLTGNNADLAFFGFQLTATKGAAQAGTFSNLGSNKHAAMLSGLQVIEHSTALAKTGGVYEATFDWTAPAAGTGTVIFNGIINGVNHDGGTGGDKVSEIVTLSLTESTPPTGIAGRDLLNHFSLSPVPASDRLQLNGSGLNGAYTLAVYDLNGKVLWQGAAQTQNNNLQAEIPVSQLATGTYFLHLKGKEGKATRAFTKK